MLDRVNKPSKNEKELRIVAKLNDANCHSLTTGDNAAILECEAEERDYRKFHADNEFYSKIKRAVDRRG